MNIENYYKYDEIKEHFNDWIKDQDNEWINQNIDDLHYHAFNCDYYIIGRYEAEKWLSDRVFEVINIIKVTEVYYFYTRKNAIKLYKEEHYNKRAK